MSVIIMIKENIPKEELPKKTSIQQVIEVQEKFLKSCNDHQSIEYFKAYILKLTEDNQNLWDQIYMLSQSITQITNLLKEILDHIQEDKK